MQIVVRAFEVIVRRRVAAIVALLLGIAVIVLVLKFVPKTYQASAQVLIVAANNGRDPSVTSVDLPAVATSTVVLSRVVHKLNLPIDLIELKRRLRARVGARSSIMAIDYRDKRTDRAVAVPNAIADELVTYYDTISSNGADVTIRKLDVAIGNVEQRLRRLDTAASAQAKLHPFIQSESALDTVTGRLDDFTTQRRFASAALAADLAQQNALLADPQTQAKLVRYEKLQNDLTYRNLAAGTAKDAAQLVFTKADFTEQYPALRVLEKKVAAERSMSAVHERATLASADSFSTSEAAAAAQVRRAQAVVTGDQAKLAAIDALIASSNTRLGDTLGSGVATGRLKLQRDAAKADFLALSARRVAAVGSSAEALSLGSLVVVDRAVRADTAVVGLGPARLAFVMGFFALAFALATALIAEALDPRLWRADQIQAFYGVPLVATIGDDNPSLMQPTRGVRRLLGGGSNADIRAENADDGTLRDREDRQRHIGF